MFESEIAYYNNGFEKKSRKSLIFTFLEKIGNGTWKEEVERLRIIQRSDKKTYDKEKTRLSSFAISGFRISRAKDASEADRKIAHSGWLQGDFDAKDHLHLTVDGMREILESDPHVGAVFVSPSGAGVKALIKIPASVEQHRCSFLAAAKHFAGLGLIMDPSTKDPGRLCFASWDPGIYIADSEVEEIEPIDEEVGPHASETSTPHTGSLPLEDTPEDVAKMLSHIDPNPGYEKWLEIASAVYNTLSSEAAYAVLNNWSPEAPDWEYKYKDIEGKKRLKECNIQKVVAEAALNGYDPRLEAKKKLVNLGDFKDYRLGKGKQKVSADMADQIQAMIAENDSQEGEVRCWFLLARGRWMFDVTAKLWMRFDEETGLWGRDEIGAVVGDIIETVRAIHEARLKTLREALKEESGKVRTLKSGKKSAKLKEMENRVDHAARQLRFIGSESYSSALQRLAGKLCPQDMQCTPNDFDKDPLILALKGRELMDCRKTSVGTRRIEPTDRITKRLGTHFDMRANCPKFDAFLARAMCDDKETVEFVWRAIAYSLTGQTDLSVFFFLYGSGANGKSTFLQTLQMLLADFQTTMDVNVFLQSHWGRGDASVDYKKARMKGCRTIFSTEIPDSKRFSEAVVKDLASSDPITARNPAEKPFVFKPTHKLWAMGNHMPTVVGTDEGIWRRIVLIPFTNSIPKNEQRPIDEMLEEFREELPGILNRALMGFLRFRQTKMTLPKRVKLAIEEYRDDEDIVAAFIDECLEKVSDAKVPLKDIYAKFREWVEATIPGNFHLSRTRLKSELEKRTRANCRRGKGNVMTFHGLQIKSGISDY